MIFFLSWGKSDYLLSAMAYIDHRYLLPTTHILRAYGQLGRCCPKNFYSCGDVRNQTIMEIFQNRQRGTRPKYFEGRSVQKLDPCDSENGESIVKFLSNKAESFTWYHRDSKYFNDASIFADCLYFLTCDYRPYTQYRRVTNTEYLEYGRAATNEDSLPVKGVKGVWEFSQLEYANVEEMVNSDPFHVLMNVAKNTLAVLKGERAQDMQIRSFSFITDCHPSLHSKTMFAKVSKSIEQLSKKVSDTASNKSTLQKKEFDEFLEEPVPCWVLTSTEQKSIDQDFLKNMLIPTGYIQDSSIISTFTKTGFLNGNSSITVIESIMDYITYCIALIAPDYPKAYLQYLKMLSNLFSNLLSPMVSESSVNVLYNQTVEVVSLHSGMFPLSESTAMYHQLIHLPQFIRQFGPLRGWWSFPAERSMSEIKTNVVKGGVSYYIPVARKQFYSNFAKLRHIYNNKDKCFPIEKGKYDEEDGEVSFGDFRTEVIFNRDKVTYLPDYHKQRLVLFLVEECKRLCSDERIRTEKSPLYRLYQHFNHQKKQMRLNRGEFYDWVLTFVFFNRKEHVSLAKLPKDFDDFEQYTSNNVYFQEDWEFACNLVENEVCISDRAYIYGTRFKARGIECSEQSPLVAVTERYGAQPILIHSNENNSLLSHAFEKRSYSSWCKLLRESNDRKNNTDEIFCQINYFFKLNLRGDGLLNGHSVANVTARKTFQISPNLYEIKLSDPTNIYSEIIFVGIYNIFPSPIATVVFNDNARNTIENISELESILQKAPNSLISLKLFSLDRSRDAILIDKDIKQKLHPYYNYKT